MYLWPLCQPLLPTERPMRKQNRSVLEVKECVYLWLFQAYFKVCFSKREMHAPCTFCFFKMPALFFSFFHMNLVNIMEQKDV